MSNYTKNIEKKKKMSTKINKQSSWDTTNIGICNLFYFCGNFKNRKTKNYNKYNNIICFIHKLHKNETNKNVISNVRRKITGIKESWQ